MKYLMCAPQYFSIDYEINPWMNMQTSVDLKKTQQQWQAVYDTLKHLGAEIVLIEPQPNLPDMTFAGDCGLAIGNTFLVANFRHEQRQREAAFYAQWFQEQGYAIHYLPQQVYFEGLGDVVWYQNRFVFGYGLRASQNALPFIQKNFPQLECVCELQIVDERFYHIAIAFSFLDAKTVLYYPPAFSADSQKRIQQLFPESIAVDDVDGLQNFVCNNITLNRHVLLSGCSKNLQEKLRSRHFEVLKLDVSEFKKSGASIRCLALDLM